MMKILVLGGNGFIGRNIVSALLKQNEGVTIGSRQDNANGNVRKIRIQTMLQKECWMDVLKDFDLVINAVGILRERNLQRSRETYEKVHTQAPTALAQACAELDVRLIHISAIGLKSDAQSRFLRSKLNGEQGVLTSGANAVIVRPSLLDGEGGYGAMWFRRVAQWPIQVAMKTEGLIAPLQVKDLGEAIANLSVARFETMPKVIELGGREVLSIPEYLTKLRMAYQKNAAIQILMPAMVVRIVSHILDVLAWTPLSFGHFELMQGYNAPANNYLPILLGRVPSAVGVSTISIESQKISTQFV
ncbi:MAG: sugar nucleotide-binding protein [Methylotenera sp.]|nr:sugar nucleotide-binding protein [Methylotenera sp.]